MSDEQYLDELEKLAQEFLDRYDIYYPQGVYNLMDDAIDVYLKWQGREGS